MITIRLASVFLLCTCWFVSESTADLWIAGADFASAERDSFGNNRAGETNFSNQIVPVWSYGSRTNQQGISSVSFTGATNHVNDFVSPFFRANSYDGFLMSDNFGAIFVNHTSTSDSHFQGVIGSKEIFFHPGQSNLLFPLIRFTAPTTGLYSLDAHWRHLNLVNGGDGGFGHVVLNGTTIDTKSWASNDGSQKNVNFASLSLLAGDRLDFVIDGGNDTNSNSTAFNATITAVPEPSSIALLGLCGCGVAVLRRCRKGQGERAVKGKT